MADKKARRQSFDKATWSFNRENQRLDNFVEAGFYSTGKVSLKMSFFNKLW